MDHDGEEQFRRLYGYHGRVVSFFKRLGFDQDDASDLAQETYVRVFRSMEDYRGEARWNYLETTARRIAANELRRRAAVKRAGIHIAEDDLVEQADHRAIPADARVDENEKKARLQAASGQLDPKSQTLLRMYVAGLSYREMALAFGTSENAVKTLLRDIRTRLKELVGEDPEDLGGEP